MIELRAIVQEHMPERVVTSEVALAQLLEEASSQSRTVGRLNIVRLVAPNGDQLSLVIGGNETVLGYTFGHGNPPYYASRGSIDADAPLLTAYEGLEHHTEFPRRWVIPASNGPLAAREFLQSGQKPMTVKWVES